MARFNLKDKLNRFDSQVRRKETGQSTDKYPERYRLLAETIRGELVAGAAGCYCLVRTFYPNGFVHGRCKLNLQQDVTSLPVAAYSTSGDDSELRLSSLLYIDTETTGLGGSGTVAFLIGCGRVVKDGFEILQYVLPDYSDEAAMLQDVHNGLNANNVVVSFNGASFDLPILTDRMIINRVARELNYHHHIDLLHSARRLFRRRLKDCTLINLERQLFSFFRDDDIPGYLVPSVYFDWLTSQDLTQMSAVLEHNRLDIISLHFLSQLIATAYMSKGETLEHVEDLHSLSRIYSRRKQTDKVETVYRRLDTLDSSLPEDAALFYAQNFKRTGNHSEATKLWESISSARTMQGFRANVELSMYHEHRVKDFNRALKFADVAGGCSEVPARHQTLLRKRIDRLKRRIRNVESTES